MSWSLTTKASKDDAAEQFAAAHRAQSAYQHEQHKAVMDEITRFSAAIAALAPNGAEVNLTSNGHIQDDGCGSLGVQLSFWKTKSTT